MIRTRRCRVVFLLLFASIGQAQAGLPAQPLRYMPAEADLLVGISNPRRLVESVTGLKLLEQLQRFSAFREAADSTQLRRARQFLAYYEKELGADWPKLLDDLAGEGILLGIKVGSGPAPAVAIVQGRDAKRLQMVRQRAIELLKRELERNDDKTPVVEGNYLGSSTLQVGDNFFAATADATLVLANDKAALQHSLDLLHKKGGKSSADLPSVMESNSLLPSNALATLWLNMETVRKLSASSSAFKQAPREDVVQTIALGGYMDLLARTPFVAAALTNEGQEFTLSVRLPRGRHGMGGDATLFVPPAGAAASRPLLQPPSTLYSLSFYFNASAIWNERTKLFPEKVVKNLEQTNQDFAKSVPGKILPNLQVSKFLTQLGPYHRFVVVNPAPGQVRRVRGLPLTGFALVSELRDPDAVYRTLDTGFRAAGFFGSLQRNLKLVEEKIGATTLVGFRVPDDEPLDASFLDNPFQVLSPCYARVGDQFLSCSSLELGREMVQLLQAEQKSGSAATSQSRVSTAGLADYLALIEDQVITQAVLDRALPADVATREVRDFLALLKTLGGLTTAVQYDEERFTIDLHLQLGHGR